jgi:glycosyltransferase involved in cell wall biosynthesis
MQHLPSFTIVTPSFNQGRFIEDTILSTLVQRDAGVGVQYVVCDGGSTDQTAEVIQKHRDRIDHVVCEKDRGQSDAINKGFARATGDIINWLNSDDYLFPGALRRVAEVFADDPTLDVVYGDCVYTTEDGSFLRYFTEVRPFDRDVLLNRSNFIMQPACFYRREAASRIGFVREQLKYTMDWDLWCRLAKAGCRFRYLPELLAANREHGVTKTLSGGGERQREIRAMHREHRTGVVPWAAISFALGDRLKRLAGGDRPPTLYRWVRRGKRLLRGEPQMNLYGVEAHGSRLDRAFRIRFPWYRAAPMAVRLNLVASRPCSVTVNGDARRIDGHTTIDVSATGFGHDIDLRGEHDGSAAVSLRGVEVIA